MAPDEKDLLQKTYELSQENHKILKSIRSSNRWASFFRAIYWIIIIGVAFGSFYFLQPYVNNVLNAYTSFQGYLSGVKSTVAKVASSTAAVQ